MDFHLTSQAFKGNESIPSKYTCEGENVSPPLRWTGAPQGTKSFVLIVDDPDAPSKTWIHWVVYNIPETISESKEGSAPSGALQGVNDYRSNDYKGPCPPSGRHRYFFKIYALDQPLQLPKGATKQQVEKAMQPHILGKAELIGTYQKKG